MTKTTTHSKSNAENALQNIEVAPNPNSFHNVTYISDEIQTAERDEEDSYDYEHTENIGQVSSVQISLPDFIDPNSSVLIDAGDLDPIQQIFLELNNSAQKQNNMLAAIARIETQQAKLIELLGTNQNQTTVGQDEDLRWLLNNTPISSIEILQSFEEKLNADEFKNKMVYFSPSFILLSLLYIIFLLP